MSKNRWKRRRCRKGKEERIKDETANKDEVKQGVEGVAEKERRETVRRERTVEGP